MFRTHANVITRGKGGKRTISEKQKEKNTKTEAEKKEKNAKKRIKPKNYLDHLVDLLKVLEEDI